MDQDVGAIDGAICGVYLFHILEVFPSSLRQAHRWSYCSHSCSRIGDYGDK